MSDETRRPVWRLIADNPVVGTLNMALDRALLAGRAAGTTPPTLRVYSWAKPTLSLGKFQDASCVDMGEAWSRGVDVVRRPTGGRAVLHDDELTYAVIASTRDGVPRGVVESYRYFASALAEAFVRLGVAAEIKPGERATVSSPACYLTATRADLKVGASKLSGSAQAWEGDSVLQHGSFVRTRDIEREAAILRLDDDERERLAATTCTIRDATGRVPDLVEIQRAICTAFSTTLGVRLELDEYSDWELSASQSLEDDFRVRML